VTSLILDERSYHTFSGRVSCRDQCQYSNCGLPEGSLCLKFETFPGCTLPFSLERFLRGVSPASCPLPSHSVWLSRTPSVRHPECRASSHQVCGFGHRISSLAPGMTRRLSALRDPDHCPLPEREFPCSGCRSDQLVWTRSTCCAVSGSLVGTLGTPGCSHATEQTCRGRPSQQQTKNQLTGILALSFVTCRTQISFPTFIFKHLNTMQERRATNLRPSNEF